MDNPRQVDIGGIPGGEVIVGSRYLILVAFNEVVDDGHAGFARLVVLVVFVVVGGVDDLVTDVAANGEFLSCNSKGLLPGLRDLRDLDCRFRYDASEAWTP